MTTGTYIALACYGLFAIFHAGHLANGLYALLLPGKPGAYSWPGPQQGFPHQNGRFRGSAPAHLQYHLYPAFLNNLTVVLLGYAVLAYSLFFPRNMPEMSGLQQSVFFGIIVLASVIATVKARNYSRLVSMSRGIALRKTKRVEGYVFLSWSEEHARDRSAMQGVIRALNHFGIDHFDYTLHPVEEGSTTAVEANIEAALAKSTCSLEMISAEILFNYWIQIERMDLRKRTFPRIFLCLDINYVVAKGVDEHKIIRINFSDGRLAMHNVQAYEDNVDWEYHNDAYFHTIHYLEKCCALGKMLRHALQSGSFRELNELSVMHRKLVRGYYFQ